MVLLGLLGLLGVVGWLLGSLLGGGRDEPDLVTVSVVGPLDDGGSGGSVTLVHIHALVAEGLDVEPIACVWSTGHVEQVEETTFMLGGV